MVSAVGVIASVSFGLSKRGVFTGKIEYFVTDARSNSSSTTAANTQQLTIDVDEKSGRLRVVAPLDRETTQGALFLTVHAVNTGATGPQAAHCTVSGHWSLSFNRSRVRAPAFFFSFTPIVTGAYTNQ